MAPLGCIPPVRRMKLMYNGTIKTWRDPAAELRRVPELRDPRLNERSGPSEKSQLEC